MRPAPVPRTRGTMIGRSRPAVVTSGIAVTSCLERIADAVETRNRAKTFVFAVGFAREFEL
jgi:hypothetical protein